MRITYMIDVTVNTPEEAQKDTADKIEAAVKAAFPEAEVEHQDFDIHEYELGDESYEDPEVGQD